MVNNFESYPYLTLKRLQNGDVLSSMTEKIQFNFDQIYLHSINVLQKGNKGDRGWSGLSIVGEKGNKGDVGSLIHFSDLAVDGSVVINPTPPADPIYFENDVVINSSGQYFKIIFDGTDLRYQLEYTPNAISEFTDENVFSGLGLITNHKLRHYDNANKEKNILLVKNIGGDAEYMRLLLGTNTFVGSDLDTLTLCNILGESNSTPSAIANALDLDSKPFSQLNFRFRDTPTSSASLTSLDFMYYIKSTVEWSIIKNNQATFGIKNDSATSISNVIFNSNLLSFTGGISDIETSDTTNSLIVKKQFGTWKVNFPVADSLEFGNQYNLRVSTNKTEVGLPFITPTHTFTVSGSMKAYIMQSLIPYVEKASITFDTNSIILNHSLRELKVDSTSIGMYYTSSRRAYISSTEINIENTLNQRIKLSSSLIEILFNNSVGINITSTNSKMQSSSNDYIDVSNSIIHNKVLGTLSYINGETPDPTQYVTELKLTPDGLSVNTISSISDILIIKGLKSNSDGGSVFVNGGDNIDDSSGTFDGGDVSISGGNSQTGDGGDVNISGGASTGSGDDGAVILNNNVKHIKPLYTNSWFISYINTSAVPYYVTDLAGASSTVDTALPAVNYDRILSVMSTPLSGTGTCTAGLYLEYDIAAGTYVKYQEFSGRSSGTLHIPAGCRFKISFASVGDSIQLECRIQKFGL